LVTNRSVQPEAWGRFVTRDVGTVFVQMFDAALASWVGAPAGMCIFADKCGNAVALEHNGALYSCDHFVEPKHLLGNIRTAHMLELVNSEQQRAFGKAKSTSLPSYCRRCEVRFACNGECPKNRFRVTPDGESGLNYLCAGYKSFFTHIDRPMRVMADLLRRGRYADEVIGDPRRRGTSAFDGGVRRGWSQRSMSLRQWREIQTLSRNQRNTRLESARRTLRLSGSRPRRQRSEHEDDVRSCRGVTQNTLRGSIGVRRASRPSGVFIAHRDRKAELLYTAKHLSRHVRAVGPVAHELGELLLSPVGRQTLDFMTTRAMLPPAQEVFTSGAP
jgi:radical SAM protein with 4Fe4S-binding SPASM domain